jgi:hypothetical protein
VQTHLRRLYLERFTHLTPPRNQVPAEHPTATSAGCVDGDSIQAHLGMIGRRRGGRTSA